MTTLSSNGSFSDAQEIFRDLDWLPSNVSLNRTRNDGDPAHAATTRGDTIEMQQPASSLTTLHSSVSPQSSRSRGPSIDVSPESPDNTSDDTSVLQDPRDRVVSRRLRGIHLFMITISCVLGSGLYVRSGSILRFGGPGAVLISFTAMGLLAWGVMQCIGEMLTLWPIPGALVEFVGTFVDEDLGIAVGIAYWLAYSINFAAQVVAGAGILDFWGPGKNLEGTVMFFVLPLCIILFNSFGVQIYGLSEVIGGSIKIIGVFVVVGSMIAINVSGDIGTRYFKYETIFPHDENVGPSWAYALFIAFSIAAFAYVGVDITAAIALEARVDRKDDKRSQGEKNSLNIKPVRFVATWTSFIVWAIYFFAGIMLSFNVQWNDPNLPLESFLGSPDANSSPIKSNSGFVISAKLSNIHGLDTVFTAIILLTVIFSANTNLYVASRSLFVIARKANGENWYLRLFAFFGKTNRYYVPVRAMLLSCCFLWVPFLYLSPHNSPNTTITSLLEILSQMGSVGCIIVWACECWAFIRFYNCLKTHRDKINSDSSLARFRRFRRDADDTYAWRSHGQPVTMYLALFGCLFVLIVVDGAALWHGFVVPRFLSAYLSLLCFFALWVGIKYLRRGSLHLRRLSDLAVAKESFRYLDEIRQRTLMGEQSPQPRGWGNLWGLM